MRISDEQVRKALSGNTADIDAIDTVLGVELEEDLAARDEDLVRDLTQQIIKMPDREDMVAELKAKIEAGMYNPSSEEIVDGMIRRAIADRMR